MSEKQNAALNLTDDTILDLYWDRDERAISETDKKYGKYLFAISYNILCDKFDSDECINDTYFAAWNKIPPERPTLFQRFLSKITRDISIDKYRKSHAQRRIPSELTISLEELDECVDGLVSAEEREIVAEISEVLNNFLAALSQRKRFIFVCRYYYADSVKYISKMLTTSDKNIYRELEKMRNDLRQALLKERIVI